MISDEDTKLIQQIARAADIMVKDAERAPARMTIKQRAESIIHLATLVLERNGKARS